MTKRFDGSPAVDGVSFFVREGELAALVGESGSGKTTTLKMINRLIEPDGGTIELDGADILRSEPHTLRRGIGYVIQNVGLFPHMTVAENVAVTPRLLGWPAADISQRVGELLRLVNLEPQDFAARLPDQLSGGQQQRVGFARALAARPRHVLLDEPFGALDPVTRDRLRRDFRDIQRQLALTCLMVTHDMTEALLIADRVIVMRGGAIRRDAPPADILRDPGDPYVAELVEAPLRQSSDLLAAKERAPL